MKKLSFVFVLLLVGAFVAIGQQDPWWRPLNPYGASAGVTYGTQAPAIATTGQNPAPGELWVDTDGAADGGAALFVRNHVSAAWESPGMQLGASIIFEGATADAFEIILDTEDPTVGVQVQLFPDRAAADNFYVLNTHAGEATASQFFLPTGGGIPVDAAAAAEAALAADFQVVCYRAYVPHPMTVTNTVLYEFQVAAAGADDFLGFAIYDDADAGVQLAEGATVYAADGAVLVIDHPDVTLFPGFYRLCACQNDVSAQDWLGVAQTATVTAVYNQAVSEIRYGIATNACAGDANMPVTTGALATTAEAMFVAQLQSN